MAIAESVATGLVAGYLYDVSKNAVPDSVKKYVPAVFNSNPSYLLEAERLLAEAVDELREKYKKYKTIGIFLGQEKLRREGVLAPVLDYLINSGPNPESQLRSSLQTCVVAGEFTFSKGHPNTEFGRIVRDITRTVEQKFRRSERLVGFLSYTVIEHLQAKVDAVKKLLENSELASASTNSSSNFFQLYLDDLKNVSKSLRLHGVEKITSKGTLSQDLSATYIEIEATCPGVRNKKSKSLLTPLKTRFKTEEILAEVPKVILKGPAGCGKTTVLQKLILEADFNGATGSLPIYVPLRRLERGYSEQWSIESVFHSVVRNPVIQSNIPLNLTDQLKAFGSNVVFLLDGVDELSERSRTKLWQLAADIEERLPAARIVITTRPLANVHHADGTIKDSIYFDRATFNRARMQWRPSDGFFEFMIGDLTNTQISVFVDRWFDGVDIETRTLAGKDTEWETLPRRLKAHLFTAPHEDTLTLARSPLICSLVCLIFFLRDGTLPSSRRQLYEMATQLLIEVRDSSREVRVDQKFDVIDRERRESLLQSIALEMQEGDTGVESQSIEIRRESVEAITKKWLEDHRFLDFGESELIDMLVERCAIIREPSTGVVDFVHRSFMEFLAANEIVLKRGPHSVRTHIENEQWIATLNFAMNTPQGGVYFGGALIAELVDYISEKFKKPQQKHIKRNLGYRIASLLDHRAEYPIQNHDTIRELCSIILPPSSMSEAFDCREIPIEFLGEMVDFKAVSGAGDEAIKASGFLLAQHEDARSAEYLASGFQNHGDLDLISAINYSGRVPLQEHVALKKRLSNGSFRKKVFLTADEVQNKTLRKLLGREVGIRFPFTGKEFKGWDVLRNARDITLVAPVRADWDAMLYSDSKKFRHCTTLEIRGGADFSFDDISSLFPRCRMIILEDCRHFSARGLEGLRVPELLEFRRISYPITLDLSSAPESLESVSFYSCADVTCDGEELASHIDVEYATL